MDENRLRKFAGLSEGQITEAKEDKDFADLRKKIAVRTKQVQANHKAAEKAYIQATAERLVAELGWPDELERLIELFQDDGRGPSLEKGFKTFDRSSQEEALRSWAEDDSVFEDLVRSAVHGPIDRAGKKVKL